MPKNANQKMQTKKMQGEKTKFGEAKTVISLVVFTHIIKNNPITSLRRRQSQTRRLRNGQNLLDCKGFLKLCKRAKIEARILHHY
jgi:hypothetical protein